MQRLFRSAGTAALVAAALTAFPLVPTVGAQPAAPPSEERPGDRVAYLPGGSIGIAPLPGMTPATRFLGWENVEDGTFIAFFDMPSTEWDAVSQRYALENLEAQGFISPTREDFAVDGAEDAFIVRGEQRVQQTLNVDKWVVAARGPEQTAVVIAQRVPLRPAYTKQAVEAALATLALRAPPSLEDQISALPFVIGDRAGFRPVRVTGGNSILLTDGEDNVVSRADQPVVIVAASRDVRPPPEAREDFARRALLGLAGLSDVQIQRSDSYRQDNSDWHEALAVANDRDGIPVFVQQTIRFTDEGFIRVLAVAKQEERAAWEARFRALADSLAPAS